MGMPPQVTLIYKDEQGREARAAVLAPRFGIGRGADNELVIADTNLSRRHAMLELTGDAVFVSDCGSQNGTSINGEPVSGAVEVRDGDILTLAGARRFEVRIERAFPPAALPKYSPDTPGASAFTPLGAAPVAPAPQAETPTAGRGRPTWLSPMIIAPLAAVLLLAVLVVALLVIKRTGKSAGEASESDVIESAGAERESPKRGESLTKKADDAVPAISGTAQARSTTIVNDARPGVNEPVTPASVAPSDSDDLSRDIKRVMSRISNDSAPYISPQGVKDVTAKVRQYRGSASLRDQLRAMQRGCGDVGALAHKDNINSMLVMYAAIAESGSGGGGDPASVARQMLPKLLTLSSTFGTASANSSLLLIAAYPYPFEPEIGSRERRAHPLATKLVQAGGSHSTEEASVARTVWYLREKEAIMPEAYDLVIRLLAVGVIAENPARFGVDAPPLLC